MAGGLKRIIVMMERLNAEPNAGARPLSNTEKNVLKYDVGKKIRKFKLGLTSKELRLTK